MPRPCKIISASKAQAYAKVHFVEGALSQVMLSIPPGRGVCMCGTYHFMVNLTADMVYFVGGKTHTIHNIPSGKLHVSRVYAPGAGHSALTQQKVHGWGKYYTGIYTVCTCRHTHVCKYAHTCTRTHARTHTRTHAHTHTHTSILF